MEAKPLRDAREVAAGIANADLWRSALTQDERAQLSAAIESALREREEQARAAGRDAGLEESAKVCEERSSARDAEAAKAIRREPELAGVITAKGMGARECAEAIEALRATPAASGNGATDG